MLRVTRSTLALVSITLTFVGCQDAARQVGPAQTRSGDAGPMMKKVADEPAPLVRHIISPAATDRAINVALADHYVWLDSTARGNPKLLVFMPGAKNQPVSWQLLPQEAARLGYHVIGLMYQNDVGVDAACKGSTDPDCAGNMRLEVIDGIHRSELVDVTPANSIDNRLTKLLIYLDAQFPDEGWSRFLEDDAPKWSQIAVSGQSQGAGQAAMIGKIRHVDRVIMFSGPPDGRVPGEAEAWISIGETPAVKYFGLFHNRDQYVAGIRLNLAALDLQRFGEPVMPELSAPPYGGTHILVTDLNPQKGYVTPNPHQSSARDDNTPLGPDGTPLLRDAWRYVLGEPPHRGAEKVVALRTP